MAGHQIYRESCLGKALKSALDQMELVESLPVHLTDVAMQVFDAAVLDDFKSNKCIESTGAPHSLKGEIRDGVVESYRFVDNVWTFDLASATFKGVAFAPKIPAMKVHRIRVIAADVKVVELPTGNAGPSGAGLSSDAHLLAQFDGASCELPPSLSARAMAACDRGASFPIAGPRVEPRQRPPTTPKIPQADGDVDDDFLEEEEEDDWEDAPAPPVGAAALPTATHTSPAAFGPDFGRAAPADEDGLVEEEEDLIEEEDDDESSRQAGGGAKRGAAERGADGGSAEARKRARGEVAEEPAEGDWEEELNSEDDMDGSGASRAFDNVIIAQYDSVKRIRNRWLLKLKDGMARLDGVDYVFTDVTAEWAY